MSGYGLWFLTLPPGRGAAQLWDGFSAQPGGLLGGLSSPQSFLSLLALPTAGTTCLWITIYEIDFLLGQVLQVGAEELEIA